MNVKLLVVVGLPVIDNVQIPPLIRYLTLTPLLVTVELCVSNKLAFI